MASQFLTTFKLDNIFDNAQFTKIKSFSYDLIESGNKQDVVKFSRALESAIRASKPVTDEENTYLRVLMQWMFRLKLFGFSNLSEIERSQFFSRDVLHYVVLGLEPMDQIQDYFSLFNTEETIKEISKNYLRALQENTTQLGDVGSFKQINFQPTVASWIKEYQAYRIKQNNLNPDKFAVNSFMNNDPAVKLLEGEEKQFLIEMLAIFNYLLAAKPVVFETRTSKYSLETRTSIPDEVYTGDADEEAELIPPVPMPPVRQVDLPQVRNMVPVRNIAPVEPTPSIPVSPAPIAKAPVQSAIVKPVVPVNLPPIQPPPVILGSRSANVHDLLKRQQEKKGQETVNGGLGGGIKNAPQATSAFVPSSPKPSPVTAVPAKPVSPPVINIDAKLEALKKRKSV